ncbi:MAG: substrate-binding domain-containing protein [Candidatus Thermoplasmatota archaeon]
MHFRFAKRWLVGLLAAAVLLVAVGAYLSLPRAYLLMATTTSTRDTGLLPYLLPEFTADTGIQVRYVAVGTGQALDAGRRGDVDVVMVHAPRLEEQFLSEGHGLCRNSIMYNRFVVVGPAADPADVQNATSATDAFLRIHNASVHNASATFESRADNSGTHTRELDLWAAAGLDPSTFGPWYETTEQGMGATLTIANERDAYTLSDDGTWYAREASLPYLALLHAQDEQDEPLLQNPYSVIPVNPSAHPSVLVDQAVTFARWLVGARAQSLIGAFTVNGHAIFTPDGAGGC